MATDYPCPECGRHIPVNEDTCDGCWVFTGPVEPIKRQRPAAEPKKRLSRKHRPPRR